MTEVRGATSIEEREEKHANGDFLAEHYCRPPLGAIEASEETILNNSEDEDDVPPLREE